MKAILYYCCALVIGLQAANAQQKTQELFNYFSQPQPISWAVSLPNAPSLPIKWQERKVASQPREFRSFVGYYQDHFVGVITLSKEYATGEIFYQGNSYLLETSEKGVVSIKKD